LNIVAIDRCRGPQPHRRLPRGISTHVDACRGQCRTRGNLHALRGAARTTTADKPRSGFRNSRAAIRRPSKRTVRPHADV